MLTSSAVANAKPRAKPYKLADERGLFLLARPNGAHWVKMKQPHLVPLSTQVVAILRDLQPLTGSGRYVFPGAGTTSHHPCPSAAR